MIDTERVADEIEVLRKQIALLQPELKRLRARDYKARVTQERLDAGLCVTCGLDPAPAGRACDECRIIYNAKRGCREAR